MIMLRAFADRFTICHIAEGGKYVYRCSFKTNYIPENTRRHIHSLFAANTNSLFYFLNDEQDGCIQAIFKKIIKEQHTGYLFSESLQKTYLIELIHCITKIHLGKFLFPSLSWN